MSNTLTPVGVPLATFARQVASLIPGVGPATPGTLGAVKVGSGLAVAGDGTLSATLALGTTTGTAADGGVVAGFSSAITAANTNASTALAAANAAQPKIAAASGGLLGGPSTLGGSPVAYTLAPGLALSGGALAVAYGTAANTALQGSMLGAASGVAGLDANASVSANTIIATGASAGTALGLGDFAANVALFGGNLMVSPLATNITYATGGTGNTGTGAVNIQYQVNQGQTGLAYLGPPSNDYSSQTSETTLCFGLGAGGYGRTSGFGPKGLFIGYGAANINTQAGVTALGFGVLNISNGAGQDTGCGSRALINQTTGGFNSAFGSNAGATNTTGVQSLFAGHGAGGGLDYVGSQIGGQNFYTALGTYALQGSFGGGSIVGVGTSCMPYLNCYLITSKSSNGVYIGPNIGWSGAAPTAGTPGSGVGNATGSVFVGAGILNNSGVYTTYSGNVQTTSQLSTVNYATIVGAYACGALTTNNHCVFGYEAAQSATAAVNLSVFGYQNLNSATTPAHICSFGDFTAQYFLDGANDIFIGPSAAQSFLSCNQTIIIGAQAASGGATFKATASGTTLTVTSRINGSNPIVAGPLYVEGSVVAQILPYGTSGTTGTGGNGTYALSTSLTYATSTPMATADFSNLIGLGYGINPTASNQAYIGNSSLTSCYIGGVGGLLSINGSYSGLGNGSLAAATSAMTGTVATGAYSAQYATSSSYSAYLGASSGNGFLAGNYNIALGNNASSGGSVFNATISGTTMTVLSRINGNNLIVNGPLFVNGAQVANITGQTSGTTGQSGTYTLDTSLTYATSTQMAGADFSHTIVMGYNINPSANYQIVIGGNLYSATIAGALSIATGATGTVTAAGAFSSSNALFNTIGNVNGSITNVAAHGLTVATNYSNSNGETNLFVAPAGGLGAGGFNIYQMNTSGAIANSGSPVFNIGAAGNATFIGSVSAAGGILGLGTGTAVASGVVGRIVSSGVSAASSIAITTSGTAQNVTSITLPAGLWDISASIGLGPAGALSVVKAAISTTTGSIPTQPNNGGSITMQATFTSGQGQFFPGMYQQGVSVTPAMVSGGTNVFYLVGQITFGSTCNFYGQISAELRG